MPRSDPAATQSSGETTSARHPMWMGLALGALALGVLAAAFVLGSGIWSVPTLPTLDEGTSLWLIFFAGLSIGGLSCMAVQGGLMAAMIAQRETRLREAGIEGSQVLPVASFLLAKLVAYTLLGGLLGLVGSRISPAAQGVLLILVALFMIVVVLQMFDVHPAFRRLSFTPPKSVQRFIRNQSRQDSALGPIFLGLLTVAIPCGVTLAMEGLAVASESPARGAAIMAAFTLGTSPLFLLLALLATRLSRVAHRIFQPVAALTIVIVAGMSMVSGARLLGYGASWVSGDVVQSTVVADAAGAPTWQEATVNVLETAYEPARLQLKAGLPTRLQLVTDGVTGCMRSFTVPAMGIDTVLPVTGEEIIELPAAEPGDYVFACGMAMFSGAIEVIQ